MIGVQIKDRALQQEIGRALKRNPKKTAEVVTRCILDLAGRSAQLAPIESGDLRNNCHGRIGLSTVFTNQAPTGAVVPPSTRIEGEVGYSLPYALRQHEDLSLRHDRTDGYVIKSGPRQGQTVNMVAGGQAKYLEEPFLAQRGRYLEMLKRIPQEVLDED